MKYEYCISIKVIIMKISLYLLLVSCFSCNFPCVQNSKMYLVKTNDEGGLGEFGGKELPNRKENRARGWRKCSFYEKMQWLIDNEGKDASLCRKRS